MEPLAKRREVPWGDSAADLGDTFAAEDKILAARAQQARSNGCTLRFIQRIVCDPPVGLGRKLCKSNCKATVQLEEVPLGSNLALVTGAIYHFAFLTDLYHQNPLIVQVGAIFYFLHVSMTRMLCNTTPMIS